MFRTNKGANDDTEREVRGYFRRCTSGRGAFVIPNPPLECRAQREFSLRSAFEALAIYQCGICIFNASCSLPDSPQALTRDEILANAKSIVEATELPVSADLQNGFGHEPDACAETIRLAAQTGLAGGSIEDSSGETNEPIYDFKLAVERVAAAAEAAHNSHFLLTARTENFLCGRVDLHDTIRRLKAFAEAGADVLYAPGLPSLDAIREVCASVPKPVNVSMGLKGATYTVEELGVAGVKRISVGGSLARAALGAFVRAAREIKDEGTFTFAKDAISHAEATGYMKGARP